MSGNPRYPGGCRSMERFGVTVTPSQVLRAQVLAVPSHLLRWFLKKALHLSDQVHSICLDR